MAKNPKPVEPRKEIRLKFTDLEVRGVYMQQQALLSAQADAEKAAKMLEEAEADSAKLLDGRVPPGITIRHLRVDQGTSAVYAPAAPAPKKGRR